ncbi:uncharacterized protein DNG_07002 [Cephalotrichum gorgonifer]|uniref:Uncharacterized protein n=1 Tax=Cephalotrichum gorgonifer TaxID=2041049 RepID=A0AAE8SX25_9PEZI|nr:uncharacterized protein DNG_07002 [Cephalotrichum gorgonifer]
MATNGKSEYEEDYFQVTTPPPATPSPKKKRVPAAPSAATGDGAGNESAGAVSNAEARLLIEMLLSSGPAKFNWAAISDKLELPSAGATHVPPSSPNAHCLQVPQDAKRAERLLKRFDLKMSDISGGNTRSPKKNEDGAATPRGKRKTGGDSESPTKRTSRVQASVKNEISAKEEYDDENEAGGGAAI